MPGSAALALTGSPETPFPVDVHLGGSQVAGDAEKIKPHVLDGYLFVEILHNLVQPFAPYHGDEGEGKLC